MIENEQLQRVALKLLGEQIHVRAESERRDNMAVGYVGTLLQVYPYGLVVQSGDKRCHVPYGRIESIQIRNEAMYADRRTDPRLRPPQQHARIGW